MNPTVKAQNRWDFMDAYQDAYLDPPWKTTYSKNKAELSKITLSCMDTQLPSAVEQGDPERYSRDCPPLPWENHRAGMSIQDAPQHALLLAGISGWAKNPMKTPKIGNPARQQH